MKKLLIIGILVLCLLLVNGCSNEPVCNVPYFEYKTGECCLDKNSNQICDNDEKEESPIVSVNDDIKEDEESIETAFQPVQALTVESCTDLANFDCLWSYITKDEIQLKLKAKKVGIIIIEKIEIPNVPCTKIYKNISLENGMKYNDIRQLNIGCDFKKNSVDSDLYIYMLYYPPLGFRNENVSDKWTGYIEPTKMVSSGWISGMIR